MIVVSNAGPLAALAKVEALDILFGPCGRVLTTESVREELVTAGLRVGAEDAALLAEAYAGGELTAVQWSAASVTIAGTRLHRGEADTIALAIEREAAWVLLDDLKARRAGQLAIAESGRSIGVRGTIGGIAAAVAGWHTPASRAIEVVNALRKRRDVWIKAALYDRLLATLAAGR